MTKTSSEKKDTSLLLSGKAFWASVRKPNELSGKYQLDLSIDTSTKETLEGLGITVKNATKGIGVDKKNENDLRGDFVTLKKMHQGKDGTIYAPPQIVDGKKNPVPSDVMIGNGSLINIAAHTFETKKAGTQLGFSAIQIKTLVEFSRPKAVDSFKEIEGFTVESDESPQSINKSSSPFE